MSDMQASDLKISIYRLHILIGLTVLLLTLGRVLWIFLDKRPPAPEMSKENFYLYKGVQILTYIVLVFLTLSGFFLFLTTRLIDVLVGTTNNLPTGLHRMPPALIHNILSKILIGLLIVHILGVIYHQYAKSDLLSRMGIKLKFFYGFYNN